MTVPQHLLDIIEDQRKLVLELDDPKITHLAERIAYYSAMLDAAEADPMDEPELQEAMLAHFKDVLTKHIEEYQSLVNEQL